MTASTLHSPLFSTIGFCSTPGGFLERFGSLERMEMEAPSWEPSEIPPAVKPKAGAPTQTWSSVPANLRLQLRSGNLKTNLVNPCPRHWLVVCGLCQHRGEAQILRRVCQKQVWFLSGLFFGGSCDTELCLEASVLSTPPPNQTPDSPRCCVAFCQNTFGFPWETGPKEHMLSTCLKPLSRRPNQ